MMMMIGYDDDDDYVESLLSQTCHRLPHVNELALSSLFESS